MQRSHLNRNKKDAVLRLGLKAGGVLLLGGLTLVLMHAAWGMYTKMALASQGQEEAEAQLARLRAQEQGVTSTLGDLSSKRGEEEQIRQRFALARPGEGEIDIVAQPPAASTTEETGEGWWQRLLHALIVW